MLPFIQTKMNSGFFTRPQYLAPHPRLPERWIAAIHLALVQAFELMRTESRELSTANEDEITYWIEEILENRFIRGVGSALDLSFIRSITRESATANYDETSIGRKPDLVIRLNRELSHTHNRVQDSLFAECKPVGRKHPLKDHYCAVGKRTSGIERFVCGAYASAMEQGLMIGYVRDQFEIICHLAKALADVKCRDRLGDPSPLSCVIGPSNQYTQGLYRTAHTRLFTWPDGSHATPIDIYHSWHVC